MKLLDKNQLLEKLKSVKLLCLDIDGTMTDGGMYINSTGDQTRRFFAHDGLGLTMIRNIGVEVAFITSSEEEVIKRRAETLKIKHLYMKARDKGDAILDLSNKLGLAREEIIHMGDDVNDIGAFMKVGLPIGVNNLSLGVKDFCCYITEKEGGKGAVREVCDMLLFSKTGKYFTNPYLDSNKLFQ